MSTARVHGNPSSPEEGINGDFKSLPLPVYRGSTIVFNSLEQFLKRKTRAPDGYTYGTTGTPTQRELERRIGLLEGDAHCVVFPSGQAAICAVFLSVLRAGDHFLLPETCYGPAKSFAKDTLKSLGVNVEIYDPRIGEDIEKLFRATTRLVWMESPGSITMELQEVRLIASKAAQHGVLTAIDNTWASPIGFKALDHGVDFSVHACTKYFSGHSDVLMGSVATRRKQLHVQIRDIQAGMGLAVSPDDCFLVARGLETLDIRQRRQSITATYLAQNLESHPSVGGVFYPPLPSNRDHSIWIRDFKLGGCLLSFSLVSTDFNLHQLFFNSLRRIYIGASWGGAQSLIAYYSASELSERRFGEHVGSIIRISAGLEDQEELWKDLSCALDLCSI